MVYKFKTPPYDHQRKLFNETCDIKAFAVFWEQGTGKTKLIVDTAAHLFLIGEIDAMLVIAPNGVHDNWTRDELPAHLPDEIVGSLCLTWHSKKAKTKQTQRAVEDLLQFKGFAILAMSYDALVTKAGHAVAKRFLTTRKCMMVADESGRIKSPKAKRTKQMVAAGKLAPYKRILTGTPVGNSPFDLFSQINFLKPDFWTQHGLRNFFLFKTHFGLFRQRRLKDGHQFQELMEYRRLPELRAMLADFSSRVVKDDVLDLPPKVYQKRYFDLDANSRKMYEALKTEMVLWLESGERIEASLAIVRLMKLQQLSSGFIKFDDDQMVNDLGTEFVPSAKHDGMVIVHDDKYSSRVRAFLDMLEDHPGKIIVWARFTQELNMICEALANEDIDFVRYDGTTPSHERVAAIKRFQSDKPIAMEELYPDDDWDQSLLGSTLPPARVFAANAACAGEGLTLHAAGTVAYFSNSFKLTERLQSEDRAHRIGQTKSVNYIDFIARDTIDNHIVKSLREKKDVAAQVTGDKLMEWI